MKELDAKALHEELEAEVESPIVEKKEETKSPIKSNKKNKSKGERYSKDAIDRAFMKLKK